MELSSIFRSFHILPVFTLLAAENRADRQNKRTTTIEAEKGQDRGTGDSGVGEEVPKEVGMEVGVWRKYRLESADHGITCEIEEFFVPGVFELDVINSV